MVRRKELCVIDMGTTSQAMADVPLTIMTRKEASDQARWRHKINQSVI